MWHVYNCDRNGQFYTGITTNMSNRMRQHKATLLYSESHEDRFLVARRAKQIKGWTRKKKLELANKSE